MIVKDDSLLTLNPLVDTPESLPCACFELYQVQSCVPSKYARVIG